MKKVNFITLLCSLVFLLTFTNCSDREPPIVPHYDPEVIVEISGSVSLKYEAQGTVSMSPDGKTLMFGSTVEIDKKKYGLAFAFVFKDSMKTGQMPFANTTNKPDSDYAVAAFEIGSGSTKETFISQSGTATLTNIQGTKLFGEFQFIASDNQGLKEITAKNGILQANQ